MSLVAELKRRKVFKVGAAYLVVAWLAVQAASIGFPAFDAPPWVLRVFILIALIGFPIAVVMAWVFDVTPDGLRFDTASSGNKRLFAAAGSLVVLALGWYFYGQPAFRRDTVSATASAGAPAPATMAAAPLPVADKSIAVLPFENLSDEKANAYFAEGMQDEILTRLAKIGALKVISRTSTMQYGSKPGNLPEIARQLGVTNILEGSVQKAANRVRINVQLIRAEGDSHLWAETYDRTLDDIFGVQGEVAGAIADKLGAQLSGGTRQELAVIPTRNTAAYDAYLRGLALYRQGFSIRAYRTSAQAFEEAVKVDPEFAQAWALLSRGNGILVFFGADASQQRKAATLQALQNAERLGPDLQETLAARAYYAYRVERNYADARRRLEALHERWPNDSELLTVLSYVLLRQGHEAESIARVDQALRLDPLNLQLHKLIVADDIVQRRPDDALKAIERAQVLAAGDIELLRLQGEVYVAQGDLASAGRALDKPPTKASEDSTAYIALAVLQRAYVPAIEWLQPLVQQPDKDASPIDEIGNRVSLADLQRLAGDGAAAAENYLRARDAALSELARQPGNFQLLICIAQAEAGLGNETAAFAALERLAETSPKSNDVFFDRFGLEARARLLARFGHKREAIADLRELLTVSYIGPWVTPITKPILRLDPDFDALRDDPEFQALLDSAVTGAKDAAHG